MTGHEETRWCGMAIPLPLSAPIAALFPARRTSLQGRIFSALYRDGIHDVGSLSRVSASHVAGLYGVGPHCLAELRRAMAAHGLHLYSEDVT